MAQSQNDMIHDISYRMYSINNVLKKYVKFLQKGNKSTVK